MIIINELNKCCGTKVLVFIPKYNRYCCPCLETKLTKEQADKLKGNNMKFVKSHYRGRWVGVVLDSTRRKHHDLLLVLLLKDQHGLWFPRRIIKTISAAWVTEVPEIDIRNVNPDWFKRLPKLPLY